LRLYTNKSQTTGSVLELDKMSAAAAAVASACWTISRAQVNSPGMWAPIAYHTGYLLGLYLTSFRSALSVSLFYRFTISCIYAVVPLEFDLDNRMSFLLPLYSNLLIPALICVGTLIGNWTRELCGYRHGLFYRLIYPAAESRDEPSYHFSQSRLVSFAVLFVTLVPNWHPHQQTWSVMAALCFQLTLFASTYFAPSQMPVEVTTHPMYEFAAWREYILRVHRRQRPWFLVALFSLSHLGQLLLTAFVSKTEWPLVAGPGAAYALVGSVRLVEWMYVKCCRASNTITAAASDAEMDNINADDEWHIRDSKYPQRSFGQGASSCAHFGYTRRTCQ
jgi:hypothetical protein